MVVVISGRLLAEYLVSYVNVTEERARVMSKQMMGLAFRGDAARKLLDKHEAKSPLEQLSVVNDIVSYESEETYEKIQR